LDKNPSPAKDAVWTGRLHEEGVGAFDAVDVARLRARLRMPAPELLEDRAERIRRKIVSWDRDKLETYYVRTLLSTLLLRSSQRTLGEMLPVLNALTERQVSCEKLRKTARMLALYANMLLKPELLRRRGYQKGGIEGTAERKRDAAELHDRWHAAYCQYVKAGGNPRNAASTLAPRWNVNPRTFRQGIKKAKERAAQPRSK
jgi:hypothetical protein